MSEWEHQGQGGATEGIDDEELGGETGREGGGESGGWGGGEEEEMGGSTDEEESS
jgi:hypothetical protein